jgi:hypothetical protein
MGPARTGRIGRLVFRRYRPLFRAEDFADGKKSSSANQIVGVLKHAEAGVPAVDVIRKTAIREMLFPDTGVIIPCSVRLENCDCTVGTCVYSVS